MVDEEDIVFHWERLSGEEKAALAPSLAVLDSKEVAAVEDFVEQLVKELPVERGRDAGGSEDYAVHLCEIFEVGYLGRMRHGSSRRRESV